MRKLLILGMALLLAAPAFAEDIKIGYVDLQRALNESERGKKAKTELEDLIRKSNSRIEEKIKAKDRLRDEIEKQRVVLSPKAFSEKQDELERLERDIDRLIEDSQTVIQRKQREREMGIFNDLDLIINGVGEAEGFLLILPADVILYSSGGVNITDLVIKKYNETVSEEPAPVKETPKEKPKEPVKDKPRK